MDERSDGTSFAPKSRSPSEGTQLVEDYILIKGIRVTREEAYEIFNQLKKIFSPYDERDRIWPRQPYPINPNIPWRWDKGPTCKNYVDYNYGDL